MSFCMVCNRVVSDASCVKPHFRFYGYLEEQFPEIDGKGVAREILRIDRIICTSCMLESLLSSKIKERKRE